MIVGDFNIKIRHRGSDPTWMMADRYTRGFHDYAGWLDVARRHSDLSRKYERLARYPWLSVAPGPPPPD
jgi:hypothetical protein